MKAAHLDAAFEAEDGRARLQGTAAALCRWFDGEFLRMALSAGATEYRFPATISREVLAQAGYLDAFPGGATSLAGSGTTVEYLLCPAVCYHAYAALAGQRIERPATLTAAQTCFRPRDRGAGGPSRLWEFTMREVIFAGPGEWVAARRDEWAQRMQAFATTLGLSGALEPATDLFFGEAGRGRRLLQQLKELKLELRLDTAEGPIAVASANLHETFFSKRFSLALADGRDAYTACAAFGLERWALAFLHQRGAAAAATLCER